jgi:hypothetical protein
LPAYSSYAPCACAPRDSRCLRAIDGVLVSERGQRKLAFSVLQAYCERLAARRG